MNDPITSHELSNAYSIIITTRGQITNCPLQNAPFRWPNGKVRAVNGICSPQHDFMLTVFPYEINLYDLALCIDNNDNHVFCRAHSLSLVAPLLRSGASDAARATNKLYARQSHVIVLFTSRVFELSSSRISFTTRLFTRMPLPIS